MMMMMRKIRGRRRMTQIETLELLGNQLLNLSNQINKMINIEDYQGVETNLNTRKLF